MESLPLTDAVFDDGVRRYTNALLTVLDTVDHSSYDLKEWQGLVSLALVCYAMLCAQAGTPLVMRGTLSHLNSLIEALSRITLSLSSER